MYSPLSSKNKNGEGWLSLSWTEYNSFRQSCCVNRVELSFALEFQKFCPLKGGFFKIKKVSASAWKRSPLRGGYVRRVLVKKSPGPQFPGRSLVSAYEKCPLMGGVRKQRFDCTMWNGVLVWEGWQDDFRRY